MTLPVSELRDITSALHRRRPSNQPPRRVLLAHSDALMRLVLTGALEPFGHQVDVVCTARELRQYAVQRPYDVIVTDVKLVDGDGIGVAATLRSCGVLCPVVVVSAHPDWDVFTRAQLVSSTLVLSTPVDPELLNDVVGSVSRAFANL